MRFAILGSGRITRRLVPDLQATQGVSVTAAGSRDAARGRWMAQSHGIAATGSYDEVINRDDVDAVYVALPPAMHAEHCHAAIAAGKHVLCEKPAAVNAQQWRSVWEAGQSAGLRVLDATAWLHHQRTDRFRHWFAGGGGPMDGFAGLGELRHVSASVSFDRPFGDGDHRLDPAAGGGCLLDLGWYAAGLIVLATGAVPTDVQAAGVRTDTGTLDRVTAMMTFESGVSATLSCGFDTATRKWFEVAGTDASVVCDDFTRIWNDKPARVWIHESSGTVHGHAEEHGHQERSMIEAFVGDQSLEIFYQQADRTLRTLDMIESILT